MISDVQFEAWLKDDSAIRCVLMDVDVQVEGLETTFHVSNKTYTTGVSDTPANTAYLPFITGGVKFTEKLNLEGNASLSFGDVEILNDSGERDSWLNHIWKGRAVSMYIGDVRWPRSDFRLVFSGVVAEFGSRGRDKLNIVLSDKMQRLNTPLTEVKIGVGANADNLSPLLFGECHNIEPVMISEATHTYKVHTGPIESILEVRDNGVPVSFTADLANGTFQLNQQPFGTITCSAQGFKPSAYSNNVATLIQAIVTTYGSATEKFTNADIDTDNFNAFATANTQPVGIYVKDRMNVLEVCAKLASSVGGALTMSRAGLLRIVKINLPQATAGTTVTASDILLNSLEVAERVPVVAAIRLGFCKNYTVQKELQTGIPETHKALFSEEWLSTTMTDSTVATEYRLFSEPAMIETCLLRKADADTEATRRLTMFKTQRTIYRFKALPSLMFENLGDAMTIQHSRFSLNSGVRGQIVSLTTDWINPQIDVEVLT